MSLTTLLRIIQQHNLFFPNETVVVAVSGGPDSLALLHMLYTLQTKLNIKLQIATFDHGLRVDSSADARFVQQTAAQWGIPATAGHGDVAALARESGESIETTARRARYAFLAEVAHKVGAARIAVAHNANDQAETILMHILRGAGMKGLQGMAFIALAPGAPDLKLVRPLLTHTRADLEAYCREQDLLPRQDASNDDVRFARNYIRHEVLPFLKTVNPQVEEALIRLAEITTVDQDYLESEYKRCVAPHTRREAGRVYVEREMFRTWHPALQRRCVYAVALELGAAEIGYTHIVHAAELGTRGEVGAVAQLPDGLQLRVDYAALVIERADAPLPDSGQYWLLPEKSAAIPVMIPGQTTIPGADWSLRVETGERSDAAARLVIPVGSAVMLRARQPGDRFAPLGLDGQTQTIKKWFINRKIPQRWRDRIPLLVVNGKIAAICVGERWPIAQEFAVGDHLPDDTVQYSFTAQAQ